MTQDKRRYLRFRLPTPFVAGLRCGRVDIVGHLVELSQGGGRFLTTDPIRNIASGHAATCEFWVDGTLFQCACAITRIAHNHAGTTLGLSFAEAFLQGSAAFADVLERVATARYVGAIKIASRGGRPGCAGIIGHFSMDLAKDLLRLAAHNRINRIDLARCSSIDSGGIGLSRLAIERGISVEGCQRGVRDLMSTAGLCKNCSSVCKQL